MSGEQNIVHANDVDINVVDRGAGGPVPVFLHYCGGSARTWQPHQSLRGRTAA